MKKVLALVLAATMALGMATTVFAATDDKAINFKSNVTLEEGYYNGTTLSPARALGNSGDSITTGNCRDVSSLSNQVVSYDADIIPNPSSSTRIKDFIYLYTNMFTWDSAKWTDTTAVLSAKQIRTSKLAVRTSVSAGSKAIDTVKIDNKEGRIEIKYALEHVSTKDLDFEFTVYLTFDGKRDTDTGLTFVGTMANDITEVYADDDYVDTGYGNVAHAQDFVKDIEVDLGNGISIFTKMFKDKKYYGTSTRDADAADDIVFSKYADIDNVVTLKTVGLNSTGDIVKLDTDYSDYYVYDKDMNYLGQSNEMLPYSTKYYLANKKLDVVADDDGSVAEEGAPETEDSEDGENPESGGDDGIENSNANPSTGC